MEISGLQVLVYVPFGGTAIISGIACLVADATIEINGCGIVRQCAVSISVTLVRITSTIC